MRKPRETVKAKELVTPTHADDDEIQELVDVGPLELGFPRVLHEFRVFAGKDDETVAPLRVPQHATSQQNLLVVECKALIPPY
jgi:hypothetical protein